MKRRSAAAVVLQPVAAVCSLHLSSVFLAVRVQAILCVRFIRAEGLWGGTLVTEKKAKGVSKGGRNIHKSRETCVQNTAKKNIGIFSTERSKPSAKKVTKAQHLQQRQPT